MLSPPPPPTTPPPPSTSFLTLDLAVTNRLFPSPVDSFLIYKVDVLWTTFSAPFPFTPNRSFPLPSSLFCKGGRYSSCYRLCPRPQTILLCAPCFDVSVQGSKQTPCPPPRYFVPFFLTSEYFIFSFLLLSSKASSALSLHECTHTVPFCLAHVFTRGISVPASSGILPSLRVHQNRPLPLGSFSFFDGPRLRPPRLSFLGLSWY